MANALRMANRQGLDIKFYKFDLSKADDGYKGELACEVNYANSTTLDISGELTWATGEPGFNKLISFENPLEGTFAIETQISTVPLLKLLSGQDPTDETEKKIIFSNATLANPRKTNYYVCEATTVYKDEEGEVHTADIVCHKVAAQRNYNVTYTGNGDPQSITCTFELAAAPGGGFASIEIDAEIDIEP